jgi:hypothetical protein
MATLTGKKINTTYDGLLKTEDNQPISTTKKKVTDGYGNETGLSVDSLGNVDVSDDLNVLGNAVVTGSTTANSFIKTGGTSSQFLKADGSLDSNTYITSEADTLDSVTDRGNSTTNSITVNGLTATSATVDSLEIQFGLRDQTNSLGTSGQILTSTGTATDWKSTSELGLIDGSGTANRLPKFTDADTIGNSTITDTGTKIGVNNANPTYSLDVYRNEATNILRLQNNTFSSWFGSDATGFSIETNLFKPITFKPSGVTAMTLDSSGNVTLNNNLSVSGSFSDSNSSTGTSGQVLSSTGTGTDWVNLNEISGVDGSGTANYVPKWTDGDTIGNSVIYDDGTNIGIGNNNIQDFSGKVLAIHAETGSAARIKLTTATSGVTSADGGGITYDTNNALTIINRESDGIITFNPSGGVERMRLHSTGDISFRDTATNEAFYWDASAASLGIGTTSPSGKLNITDTSSDFVALKIDNANTSDLGTETSEIRFTHYRSYAAGQNDAGSIIVGKEEAWDAIGDRKSFMSFSTRNGSAGVVEAMRIDSSGNVGIANSNPSSNAIGDGGKNLVVGNALTSSHSSAISIISGESGYSYLLFGDGDGASGYRGQVRFSNSDESLQFVAAGSERMRIDSSGNVGIGTSSPNSKLEIADSTGGVSIDLNNTGTGGESFLLISTNDSASIGGGKFSIFNGISHRFVIDSSGNVGIGTSSPARELEITGTGNVYARITAQTSADWTALELVNTGGGWSMRNNDQNNDALEFVSDTVNALTIQKTGNVGINTTDPNTNLEIGAGANIAPKLRLTLYDSGSSINDGQEYGGIQWKGNDAQGDGVRADIRVFGGGSSGESYMTFGTMPAGTSASTNAQERMRIDSSGDIKFTSTQGTTLQFERVDSTTVGGDVLGKLDFKSTDSSDSNVNASIKVVKDDVAVGTVPMAITFETGVEGVKSERMRILSSGGLTFNGDTSTSNALDDYEEGTWTPAISFGGGTTGITYARQGGTYTKIGRQVTVFGDIILSNKGTSVGDARITGLPFTILSSTSAIPVAGIRYNSVTFANQFQGYGNASQTYINLEEITEAGVSTTLTNSNFVNTSQIIVSMTYFV